MTQLAEEKGIHMSNPPRLEVSIPEDNLPWLDSLRKTSLDRFNALGFPTTKQEEYRFTNFSPISKVSFVPASSEVDEAAIELIEEATFGADALAEIVFVNGQFVPRFSRLNKLPRGLTLTPFSEALRGDTALIERYLARTGDFSQNPFAALNTGSFVDGAVIHVARGAAIDGAIHILTVSTTGEVPTLSQPRVLIVAEDNSELNFVQSFIGGPGVHWTNAVTEVVLGTGARVTRNRVDRGGDEAFRTTLFEAKLARDSRLISHCVTLGGRLTRNDLNVTMAGQGADATLNGLVVLTGNQHCDNHTLLNHAAPHCPSHELYKHVLNGQSTCVFKGKILVQQIAQKTDSKQTSKSLLLSDEARMDSQPALEIYADDVKCTHGSTTGPVDEEMVFYLRSRGVAADAARHLLTYAFAADVTRRIKVEPVRRRVEDFMAHQHGLPRDLRIADLGEHDDKAVNM